MRVLARVSRLHIVAIGALGTLTFGWVMFGDRPWIAAGLSALDWFLVNILNRVVDLREDRANGIVGTDFVAKNRRAILVVGFGLLAVSGVASALWSLPLTACRAAFHTLGFAYNWRLLPGGRRIKQLYFWKNTASAVGFLLTVFCYPLALGLSSHRSLLLPATGLAISAVFFFLFELSYEVLYDLRDAPGDKLADVRTYPVVHGERAAMRIVDGLVLVASSLLVAGYAAGQVPWRVVVMILAPANQLAYYKAVVRVRPISADDCIRLTWAGAGMLGAYHGWIALGLPGV